MRIFAVIFIAVMLVLAAIGFWHNWLAHDPNSTAEDSRTGEKQVKKEIKEEPPFLRASAAEAGLSSLSERIEAFGDIGAKMGPWIESLEEKTSETISIKDMMLSGLLNVPELFTDENKLNHENLDIMIARTASLPKDSFSALKDALRKASGDYDIDNKKLLFVLTTSNHFFDDDQQFEQVPFDKALQELNAMTRDQIEAFKQAHSEMSGWSDSSTALYMVSE